MIFTKTKTHMKKWWALTGSNRRHPPCKGGALPTELNAQALTKGKLPDLKIIVGKTWWKDKNQYKGQIQSFKLELENAAFIRIHSTAYPRQL